MAQVNLRHGQSGRAAVLSSRDSALSCAFLPALWDDDQLHGAGFAGELAAGAVLVAAVLAVVPLAPPLAQGVAPGQAGAFPDGTAGRPQACRIADAAGSAHVAAQAMAEAAAALPLADCRRRHAGSGLPADVHLQYCAARPAHGSRHVAPAEPSAGHAGQARRHRGVALRLQAGPGSAWHVVILAAAADRRWLLAAGRRQQDSCRNSALPYCSSPLVRDCPLGLRQTHSDPDALVAGCLAQQNSAVSCCRSPLVHDCPWA